MPSEPTQKDQVKIIDPASVGTNVPRSAWIEMAIFFGLALFIDIVFMDGDRFFGVHPHPFWMAVLLISVQYGTSAGLTCVMVATLVLLVGNLPEQQVDQDYYSHLFIIVVRPLEWGIQALILGELRRRQMSRNMRLRADLANAENRENSLAKAYRNVSRLNERLETRVAAQLKTVFTIFKAAQSVEQLHIGSVLVGTEELVKELLSPVKFSLYVLNKNTLEAVFNFGWESTDTYHTRIDAKHDMFQALVVERRVLCAAKAEDQLLLNGQAILAGPIVHEHTGEVLALLKIEDMGFLDLHVSTISNFAIICDWVGAAFAKAEEFETSQFSLGRGITRHLMPENTLGPLTTWLSSLAFRAQFDLWFMEINIEKQTDMDARSINKAVGDILMEFLRTTDMPFRAYSDLSKLQVLLPATVSAGMPIVKQKIETAILEQLPPEKGFPAITVHFENLYSVDQEGDTAST